MSGETTDRFSRLTNAELRVYLRERGHAMRSGLTKEELLYLCREDARRARLRHRPGDAQRALDELRGRCVHFGYATAAQIIAETIEDASELARALTEANTQIMLLQQQRRERR